MRLLHRYFLLLLVLAAASPLCASDIRRSAAPARVDLPQGDPLADPLPFSRAERDLFQRATDRTADEFKGARLIDAALVASGDEDQTTIATCRQRFTSTLPLSMGEGLPAQSLSMGGECANEVPSPAHCPNPAEDSLLHELQLIHQTLHRQLLTGGYQSDASDLAATLQTGAYNCASATILFIALCDEAGLQAEAVEFPGHVRAVVTSGDERIAVETTCPGWTGAFRTLSPCGRGQGEGAADHPSPAHLFTSSPAHCPDSEAAPRPLSRAALLAMLYYNRAIDAFQHEQFADAVVLNRKSLLLDGDNPTARGNLLAAVNNWALALAAAGRFDEAQSLLTAGRRYAPDHEPFAHNAAHIHRLQAESAISISPSPLGRGSG